MDEIVLTNDDVADLNRMAVERSAALARIGGSVLIGIGIVGVVLWLWVTYRLQDRATSVDVTFGGKAGAREASLADRIDLLSSSFGLLMSSGLVVGIGLLARMGGDYAQSKVGGSVTGFRAGDTLDDDDNDDEDDFPT